MMSWIGKLFVYYLGQLGFQFFAGGVKKRILIMYIKTLQVMRKSMLATVLILIVLQVIVLSFFGAVVIGVFLLPLENITSKLWLLFTLFMVFFTVPLVGLLVFFSEKTWLRLSGANTLLQEKTK